MTDHKKPREVYVNMKLIEKDITPWENNRVHYIMYKVCHSVEVGKFSKNEVLFREVMPVPTQEDIEEKAKQHSEPLHDYNDYAVLDFKSGYYQALKDMGYET